MRGFDNRHSREIMLYIDIRFVSDFTTMMLRHSGILYFKYGLHHYESLISLKYEIA